MNNRTITSRSMNEQSIVHLTSIVFNFSDFASLHFLISLYLEILSTFHLTFHLFISFFVVIETIQSWLYSWINIADHCSSNSSEFTAVIVKKQRWSWIVQNDSSWWRKKSKKIFFKILQAFESNDKYKRWTIARSDFITFDTSMLKSNIIAWFVWKKRMNEFMRRSSSARLWKIRQKRNDAKSNTWTSWKKNERRNERWNKRHCHKKWFLRRIKCVQIFIFWWKFEI